MRIALCDDHPIIADGIAMLLKSSDAELKIERYQTAHALLAAAPSWLAMELVLLDLTLPDADGFSTLAKLRELREDVPVVIVSSLVDRHSVRRALDLGAMGYIPKTASTSQMFVSLQTVLEGGICLPPDELLEDLGRFSAMNVKLEITPRQWQILQRILQGKPIKRIATDLNIAESTVKTHITPILRALGATSRTEAIVRASALGLRFPPAST